MSIGKSHLFGYLKNFSVNSMFSSFVHIGQINIDVPLRPTIVHDVVYRESKVIEQKILPEIKNFAIFENVDLENLKDEKQAQQDKMTSSSKYAKSSDNKDIINKSPSSHFAIYHENNTDNDLNLNKKQMNTNKTQYINNQISSSSATTAATNVIVTVIGENAVSSSVNSKLSKAQRKRAISTIDTKKSLLNKFTIHFKSKFDGCEIRAKLLENPCLKAAYFIKNVECNAHITNDKSTLHCNLNSHCLSFQCDDEISVNGYHNFEKEEKVNFRLFFYFCLFYTLS